MAGKEKKSIKDSVRGEARSFLKEVKKFGREAEELAVRGGEKIAQVSQIGKLKGEIIILSQKRRQKLGELGEKLMHSEDKSSIKDPEILRTIGEIDEIEIKWKACDEQIETLKRKYQNPK